MKVMLLAAGRGNRMRPLTDHTPKPLLAVGGRPLIVWQLQRLAAAGFRDVVINLHHLGDQIADSLGDGADLGLRIRYSRESELLETAGGIIQALPLLGESPFLLVNADIWSDIDFGRLPARLRHDADAHLVLVPNAAHHPGGDFGLDAAGRLVARTAGSAAYTYSGVALMRPRLFEGYSGGERALLPVLERAIRGARLSGEIHHGQWQDIGTPERLQALRQLLQTQSASKAG